MREAADRLLRLAKRDNITIVLVGHVTKDGSVAGPRVLEHLVDAVLQFEGDRYRFLRPARGQEPLRLDQRDRHLRDDRRRAQPVADPSAAFASSQPAGPGSVLLPAIEGTRPILVEVQALVAESDLAMPRRAATGFDRNRLAMILAVLGRHAGVPLASSDVFVNVAGGVRIDEPAADLAVAVAIVSALRGQQAEEGLACFGEIGLTGGLRPVGHTDARMREARKLGVSAVVVPKGTAGFDGVAVRGAAGIADALAEALPR